MLLLWPIKLPVCSAYGLSQCELVVVVSPQHDSVLEDCRLLIGVNSVRSDTTLYAVIYYVNRLLTVISVALVDLR